MSVGDTGLAAGADLSVAQLRPNLPVASPRNAEAESAASHVLAELVIAMSVGSSRSGRTNVGPGKTVTELAY
jgi:hypothetical protein